VREAIQQLIEFCPRSLANLRAHVVLLTGKTDDGFILDPTEGLITLERLLVAIYELDAERVLAYSLHGGLRTYKEPKVAQNDGEKDDCANVDGGGLDIETIIRTTRQEHAESMHLRAAEVSTGPFTNSPAEALRQIDRILSQTRRCFVLFRYSPMIQLVGEESPDIAPLLERLPAICWDRGHVVVFAGVRSHPILNELYPRQSQKVLRLRLSGPSAGEIESALLQEEVRQRRGLFDVVSRSAIVAALEHQGKQPDSGLRTLVDNVLRDPRCFLDVGWARENGANGFDLSGIDVESVRAALDAEIIGQGHVKREIVEGLRRLREFDRDSDAPFLRLLFVGPSGVGKTEIAKILCREVFGNEKAMLSVACTEYSQAHEVAKLLGAPPGYAGHEQPALLESHRQRWPAGLLLLDEFEKAHADVQRFFMNLLDEGKATSPRSEDGQPIVLDFTNYMVVATSNAGAREVDGQATGSVQRNASERKALYSQLLKDHFAPELLGRFSDRLVFDFLKLDEFERIARMYGERQMAQFHARCRERGRAEPELFVDPAIYQKLARTCDPALGARNLRRSVEGAFQGIWLNKYAEREPRPDRVEFLGSDFDGDAAL
jgi:hypothetical protein